MEDVKVVVTGTGDGGGLQPGTRVEALTPSTQPNIAVHVIGPLASVAIRFGHLYLVTLLGIVMAGLATGSQDPNNNAALLHYTDFADLLWKSAAFAVATPAIGLLKDLITIFGRLEQRFPFLTGQV